MNLSRQEGEFTTFECRIPDGASPGQPIVAIIDGRRISINYPAHALPGQVLRFKYRTIQENTNDYATPSIDPGSNSSQNLSQSKSVTPRQSEPRGEVYETTAGSHTCNTSRPIPNTVSLTAGTALFAGVTNSVLGGAAILASLGYDVLQIFPFATGIFQVCDKLAKQIESYNLLEKSYADTISQCKFLKKTIGDLAVISVHYPQLGISPDSDILDVCERQMNELHDIVEIYRSQSAIGRFSAAKRVQRSVAETSASMSIAINGLTLKISTANLLMNLPPPSQSR